MESLDIQEAIDQFPKLLKQVLLGDEVVISQNGVEIAKLVPFFRKTARTPGGADGLHVSESFFSEMPEDFMEHFE